VTHCQSQATVSFSLRLRRKIPVVFFLPLRGSSRLCRDIFCPSFTRFAGSFFICGSLKAAIFLNVT
jgi:hypothetical protein